MGTTTKAPTDRELLRWWDAQPKGERTCADCGRVDSDAYVQPQHPYYAEGRTDVARCGDCINKRNLAHRTARKTDLAQRPKDCARCATRPHTFTYGGFRLCGRCLTLTKREHAKAVAHAGAFAIFAEGLLIDTSAWACRTPLLTSGTA